MRVVTISNIQAGDRRVEGVIQVGRRRFNIWFSSEADSLRAVPEGFLLLALTAAMRTGRPLHSPYPISSQLLQTLPAIQKLYCQWEPGMQEVEVRAEECVDVPYRQGKSAQFFTGGVDSLYSALHTPSEALVYVSGLDVGLGHHGLQDRVRAGLLAAAGQLQRPLVELQTNLRSYSDHFLRWGFSYGGALAACAYALADRYSDFGVAASFGDQDVQRQKGLMGDGAHPYLVSMLSTGEARLECLGTEARRIDKLGFLAASPIARTLLRVCWENRGGEYNCGECEKCLRTMAAMEAIGVLDQFPVFAKPLDYRKLARAVPLRPYQYTFVQENLKVANNRGAPAELQAALEASLRSPLVWVWRLYGKYVPRRIKGWMYRRPVSGAEFNGQGGGG